MADDLDDLLDEVETKFCAKTPQKSSTNRSSRPPEKASSRKTGDKNTGNNTNRRKDDELGTIIDDICDIPEPLEKLDIPDNTRERVVTSAQKRCFPVYIGGSLNAEGLGNTSNQRSCDRLRCTDCDFKVCVFNDFEWHSSTDYLFLRNNVPDFEKLKENLMPNKGSRAYACQCRWITAKALMDIKKSTDLKWVCGKH